LENSPEKNQTFGQVHASLPSVNYPVFTVTSIPSVPQPTIHTSIPINSIESHQSPTLVKINKTYTPIRNSSGESMQTLETNKMITQAGMNYLSMETVPKVLYDKCVNECKNW
jgi:hypothetical protein